MTYLKNDFTFYFSYLTEYVVFLSFNFKFKVHYFHHLSGHAFILHFCLSSFSFNNETNQLKILRKKIKLTRNLGKSRGVDL